MSQNSPVDLKADVIKAHAEELLKAKPEAVKLISSMNAEQLHPLIQSDLDIAHVASAIIYLNPPSDAKGRELFNTSLDVLHEIHSSSSLPEETAPKSGEDLHVEKCEAEGCTCENPRTLLDFKLPIHANSDLKFLDSDFKKLELTSKKAFSSSAGLGVYAQSYEIIDTDQ